MDPKPVIHAPSYFHGTIMGFYGKNVWGRRLEDGDVVCISWNGFSEYIEIVAGDASDATYGDARSFWVAGAVDQEVILPGDAGKVAFWGVKSIRVANAVSALDALAVSASKARCAQVTASGAGRPRFATALESNATTTPKLVRSYLFNWRY